MGRKGSARRVAKVAQKKAKAEMAGRWVSASKLSKSSGSPKRSIVSLAGFVFKELCATFCQNRAVETIIKERRPRAMKDSIRLRFQHYWMQYYHEGYRGGTKAHGSWVFFKPRKGTKRIDPRRPAHAKFEVWRKDVGRFGRLTKAEKKKLKRKGALWVKHRRGWRGDPFMKAAQREMMRAAEEYLMPYVGDRYYLEFSRDIARDLRNRFGTTLTIKKEGKSYSGIEIEHTYKSIFHGGKRRTDIYRR